MRYLKAWRHARCLKMGGFILATACSAAPPGGGGGATPRPTPTPTAPIATPGVPGPAPLISDRPGLPGAGRMLQPAVTPAPGGGPTSYPEGTVFLTNNIEVSIGPGAVFTPSHVYLRPGATTTFINRDTVPHTVAGFGGATDSSGAVPPGGRYTKSWAHPGTWTFHDPQIPNSGVFTVTDVPGSGE